MLVLLQRWLHQLPLLLLLLQQQILKRQWKRHRLSCHPSLVHFRLVLKLHRHKVLYLVKRWRLLKRLGQNTFHRSLLVFVLQALVNWLHLLPQHQRLHHKHNKQQHLRQCRPLKEQYRLINSYKPHRLLKRIWRKLQQSPLMALLLTQLLLLQSLISSLLMTAHWHRPRKVMSMLCPLCRGNLLS